VVGDIERVLEALNRSQVREPFDFDEVYESARDLQLGTTTARVVPRRLLIEMKKKAGRPRDLEDIEALEQLDPGPDPTDTE
jgi:hypothetical protein